MKPLLKGMGVSKGKTIGVCRIVLSRSDFDKVKAGDILVARSTDPSYVILFIKVSGIITEIGGICSHAALVSREYGIPCIAGVQEACQKLKDGQKIVLDADKGVIYAASE